MKRILPYILCAAVMLTGCSAGTGSKNSNYIPAVSDISDKGDKNDVQIGDGADNGGSIDSIGSDINDSDTGTVTGSETDDGDASEATGYGTNDGGSIETYENDTDADSGQVPGNDTNDGMAISLGNTVFDLDKKVEYRDIVNLTADELSILRNALYARHGYIFKTAKYNEYFSEYDWYKPSLDDVSTKLTDADKSGIALIQKVERFYEKSIKLSDDERNMVGAWHLGAGVGAGYGSMYRFYEGGTYKYNVSQMVMDERNLAHGGKWFVLDGFLYLRQEREGVLVGGELVDAENPGSATEKEIVGAEYKVLPLEKYKAVELKIDFTLDIIERDYGYTGVVIGNMDFYKLSPVPEDFDKELPDV